MHSEQRRRDVLACLGGLVAHSTARAANEIDYSVKLQSIRSGFVQDFRDRKFCWVHARAGVIPGRPPKVVVTMQKVNTDTGPGSYDVYHSVADLGSDDLGKTWSGVVERAELGPREEGDGIRTTICDFVPQWHAKTRRLLGTGHTPRYRGNQILVGDQPIHSAYSVYDAAKRSWCPWRAIDFPQDGKFFQVAAGCAQRVDLADGTILLPVYFRAKGEPNYQATVARCSFDGETMRYLGHGDELAVTDKRGLAEPSLAFYQRRYYLTLRNDVRGYVTSGADGQHFDSIRPWRFDDGTELGNYNTQQHWVVHSEGLFLTYTRRGANNDHVMRHRAPLFLARVDTEKLCVIRSTERIVIPERGADLGNFGVTNVTPDETWITNAEWMRTIRTSDNNVFIARLVWNRPNRLIPR